MKTIWTIEHVKSCMEWSKWIECYRSFDLARRERVLLDCDKSRCIIVAFDRRGKRGA